MKSIKWSLSFVLFFALMVACTPEPEEPAEEDQASVSENGEDSGDEEEGQQEETSAEAATITGDAETSERLAILDDVESANVQVEGDDWVNVDLILSAAEEDMGDERITALVDAVKTEIDARPIDLIIIIDNSMFHQEIIEE